ncbi:MAG: class I SAM-dependent methyltransferase [Verrucomicrobiaceae bacterium]|nr:class I SAM-dependent methyltransferase [Verrucomicrobiaceae bacterium]
MLPPELAPSAGLLAELQLVRNPHGYYEAAQKPTREELEKYYRDLYYQTEEGSYMLEYSPEEMAYIRGQVALRHRLIAQRGWIGEGPKSLLDVGCGEGHSLAYFKSQGWSVEGLDFSVDGCRRQNPDCLPHLTQGDVFENLDRRIAEGRQYDVVMLDNVLEHVIDPPSLLAGLHRLVKPGGVLILEVPNDFSRLQMTAMQRDWIDKAFWVGLPEHLSYFNAEGLRSVCAAAGWHCLALLADFPIDWFLANPNSSYVPRAAAGTGKGSQLGKGAHHARIALENIMRETDMDKLNAFYEAMAGIGMGRSIAGFFRRD